MDLDRLNIRCAVVDDLRSVVAIYNQAIRAKNVTADTKELTVKQKLEWFEKHDANLYPVYVVEYGSNILGYCSVLPWRTGRKALSQTAEISYYIHYDYHGKGIGSELIRNVINDCEKSGLKNLLALLFEVNKQSIGLLEKFGFEKWGFLPDVAVIDGEKFGQLIYGRKI